MRSQDNRYLENGDWHRTVYINTLSVGTNEFDLDAETERQLEASGQASNNTILIGKTRTTRKTVLSIGHRTKLLGQGDRAAQLPAQ